MFGALRSNCIILFAQPYSIADERTGVINSGITVQYLLTDNLSPHSEDNSKLGYKSTKASISQELFGCLVSVPGIYECGFGLKTNGNGKPELKLEAIKFINELELAVPKANTK